ncbi:MAG: hypothetical protein FJ146_04165 [Deltaproteobacteria bacterium]|nr:hypothetical protein [Deltaproteobacteria bacterium]
MTTPRWVTIISSAVLLASSACSGGSVVSKTSKPSEATFGDSGAQKAPLPPKVNAEQLYGGLTVGGAEGVDPGLVLEDRIQKLASANFHEFINAVESRVVNDALTLDGVMRVENVKDKFMVTLPKIKALAIRWRSLGSFWRMQGLNPKNVSPYDIEKNVGRAFKYFNIPERQARPQIEQQNLQDEIDRINQEAAIGTVSRSVNSNCGKYNQPKCTPDPIVAEDMSPNQISFEACKLPSGLDLKHRCTLAGAIGGGLMMADKRLETLGAVIAAAALVCVAESTAPVAQFCSPTNTFKQDPTL